VLLIITKSRISHLGDFSDDFVEELFRAVVVVIYELYSRYSIAEYTEERYYYHCEGRPNR